MNARASASRAGAIAPAHGARTDAAAPAAPLEGERVLRIALAGGGTGGHLVPALNLLDHGVRHGRVAAVHWFLTGRPVEQRVLAGLAERLGVPAATSSLGLEGRVGAPSRLRQLLDLPRAVQRARRELAAFGADVLVGTGGFGSTPGILAARSLGVPVVLLEVNAVRGDAVRQLGRLATRVCHAMRGSLPPGADGRGRDVFTGPPDPPLVERQPSGPRLLVLGGSQGAGALNDFVARALPALRAAGVEVVHQTGPGKLGPAAEAARASGGYRVAEYIDDVAGELALATLVLCRGGASTLVEVAAARVPALVVPYPHHADRHQWRNAEELGAGVLVVEESSFADAAGADALAARIASLACPAGAQARDRMAAALASALPRGGSAAIFEQLDGALRRR